MTVWLSSTVGYILVWCSVFITIYFELQSSLPQQPSTGLKKWINKYSEFIIANIISTSHIINNPTTRSHRSNIWNRTSPPPLPSNWLFFLFFPSSLVLFHFVSALVYVGDSSRPSSLMCRVWGTVIQPNKYGEVLFCILKIMFSVS